MKIIFADDNLPTIFEVALDDLTVARLVEVADLSHVHPSTLISAIVHDVLEDDALMHPRDTDEAVTLQ